MYVCVVVCLCAYYMYYLYTTADSASSASTDVEGDKGNVTQYAPKNNLPVNNDIVQVVLQTRPSGIRQVLSAAERNVDVDVVVVRPQEVYIF